MELILIGFVALLASGLPFFSGFGLGTILMPVFVLFFPLSLAIAATAVVHFANNFFKFGLMALQADWLVVTKFSVPATIMAIVGAESLTLFERLPVLWQYSFATRLSRAYLWRRLSVVWLYCLSYHHVLKHRPFLLVGFLWAGRCRFFGRAIRQSRGISFKSRFVKECIRSNRSEAVHNPAQTLVLPVVVGTINAFLGTFIRKHILDKVTLPIVQMIVTIAMLSIGFGLIVGLI